MRLVLGKSIHFLLIGRDPSSLVIFSVRVTRETAPEAIDQLQRRKLELEVEIHALEREKDDASKERLAVARKAIADVEDQLQPLQAAYQAEKQRGDEIASVRRRMDELKAKADEAERRYDLATASDLRYYALPDLQNTLARLEAKKAEEDAARGAGTDTVTPDQIAEIVARWTNIPVTRLMSTEKEKLLRMERILAESVVGQPEAVKAVANAIRLSRSGLRNANRPIASFLFAGPSGTGKTLMSKTVGGLGRFETIVLVAYISLLACDHPLRLPRCHDSYRRLRVLREALDRTSHRCSSGLRRPRPGRPAHRVHPSQAVLGRAH